MDFASRLIVRLALLLTVLTGSACSMYADNVQANTLLQQGRVDEASTVLQAILQSQPNDAKARQLFCRVYYSQDMADGAVRECEAATASAPSESDHQVWLGRAYGLKASQANPLIAFGIAKKVRISFERGVQLNPVSVQALSDLGQFYVEAPAIVGGGLDKAATIAARIRPLSAARAHRLLGMIANKKKDTVTAEAEFQSAVAAGRAPEAYVDLGSFYQQHGQGDKAYAALQAAIAADRAKGPALVDVASVLTLLNRSPELAERCLRDYLSSSAKSDDAPAFKVHVQLGDLLLHRGDVAGALREYAAALALASNYAPAIKAMQGR
jgi:tetratricopeptide (TPR) repeat protein